MRGKLARPQAYGGSRSSQMLVHGIYPTGQSQKGDGTCDFRGPVPFLGQKCSIEEANNMRMRLVAPLLVALVGLLGAVQIAQAGNCGSSGYSCCSQPCCDAQCCFTSCQQQCKCCYKLVYDTCME